MKMRFEGSIALVTGASAGIGLAVAKRLIGEGARVALAARRADVLQTEAAALGSNAIAVPCDVADEASVDRTFGIVEQSFGPVTLLINAAGWVEPGALATMPTRSWRDTIDVNLSGTFFCCRRAIPSMQRSGGGAIVNVASISGVPGPEKFPGFTAYCAAKAGVIGLTEALAVEVASQGIRVNAVSPGSVDTGMWARVSNDAPAQMTVDEIASSILFLLSGESKPMNGRNLHVWT